MYLFLLLDMETFGITNIQILKVFKKLFQHFTGLRLSSIEMQMKKDKYYLPSNFMPHKAQNFDYKTPDWVNRLILLSLKRYQNLQRDIMLI